MIAHWISTAALLIVWLAGLFGGWCFGFVAGKWAARLEYRRRQDARDDDGISELTRCENCQQPIEGSIWYTSDDVPLCRACYEGIWPGLPYSEEPR